MALRPIHDAIAAYYRHPAVRRRIAEYCGGIDGFPAGFSALGLAGYGGREARHAADMAPVAAPATDFPRLLDEGADICRSMADGHGALVQLDIDYVNPDDPAEVYRDPPACFARLEPVYRAVRDTLSAFGVPALELMTGRGYHFTARAPLGSLLHSELVALGCRAPALLARAAGRAADESSATMDAAHEGAGRLVEFLAHHVIGLLRGRIPVPVTAADVPPPGRGPFICLDCTAYGDPLRSRHVRCAFSSHQKAALEGLDVVGPPFLLALPRNGRDLAELLGARGDPEASALLAERTEVHIPDVDEAGAWLGAYASSSLARFHRRFDEAAGTSSADAAAEYARIDPPALPSCVRQPLDAPNPRLLVPLALRVITLVLWARGWPPRRIADLVRSRYEADHGWGDLWQRYDPAARADFYVRVFAAGAATGLDDAFSFTCASQQQRGGCPGGECGHELGALYPDHSALRAMGARP